MIKVTSNEGVVDVHDASGSRRQIMSELCCIVAAVCQGWSEDEEDSEFIRKLMIETIASTLLMAEDKIIGKKVN